jgi:TusA-related sulfurtransferase
MGAPLAVIVDHEPAVRNIPRSAREWGQEVGEIEEMGAGLWRIHLRKTAV